MLKTLDDFIASRKEKIKSEVAQDVVDAKMQRQKGEPRKSFAKKVNRFKQTEEFREMVKQACQENAEYQTLVSGECKTNAQFLEEFKKWQKDEYYKSIEGILDSRMQDFLNYLVERQDMLVALAKKLVQAFDTDYVASLREDELSVKVGTYNSWFHRYEYHFEDLSPSNYADFLDQIDSDQDEAREEWYLEELDFCSELLDYLQKNDGVRFNCELKRLKEGFEIFDMDWLKGKLGDALYGDDFLSDELSEVEDTFLWGGWPKCLNGDEAEILLRENPHYKGMFETLDREKREAQEKERRLSSGILETIPASPIELYPNARAMQRKFVLHIGPTNSGKTYAALEALKAAETGVYLAPLRLLAFECYETLNDVGVPCSLITGEEERITDGARHTASTIELLDESVEYDVAVIDEAQMIDDAQRGAGWTAAILGVCAKEVHICAAPYAEKILVDLITMCGDEYEIHRCERSVPLQLSTTQFSFPKSVHEKDALIVFSKRSVLAVAAELQEKGIKCSVIYGSLPYEVRQSEVRKFVNGETDVVVTTDAIGMGMNLPIKRIVFLELKKYDGNEVRSLLPSKVQQIAGRAGRQGIFDVGWYTSEPSPKKTQKMLETKVENISQAVLGFAPALVHVDGKLSDIMEKWAEMDVAKGFKKADISDQIQQCKRLEAYTDDKELVYKFVTIPFDAKNETLSEIWLSAFRAELQGKHLDFVEPACSKTDLNVLEQAYKYCDLLYFYRRRFCGTSQLQKIMDCKARLTAQMDKLLSKQHLERRRCRDCGRPMPWNYPYGICQNCYNERRMGDWDDDWY